MSWGEAFSRAFRAVLALVVIYIIAIILIAMGGGIIGRTDGGAAGIFFGGIFILAGIALVVLSLLAVFIKTITDAITDNQPEQIAAPTPQAQATAVQTSRTPSVSRSPNVQAQRTQIESPSNDTLADRASLRVLHTQIRDSNSSHPRNPKLREIQEDSAQTWRKLNDDAAYEGSLAFQQDYKRIKEAHRQFLAEQQSGD